MASDVGTVVDVLVGVGTLALAGATTWMAARVRDQAQETSRLADIAERQLAASTDAVLRVHWRGTHTADIGIRDEDMGSPTLVVVVTNRGMVAARFESAVIRSPAIRGTLHRDDGPVIPAGESIRLHFPLADGGADRVRRQSTTLDMTYEAVESGNRSRTIAKFHRPENAVRAGEERWKLIGDEEIGRV